MRPNRTRRWTVKGLNTISALIGDDDPCGIYILEFENGESYVGQAVDVRKRFVSHWRDSAHHPAWRDITHLSFTPYPAAELNIREATMLQALKSEGRPLRNKAMNLFHEQASPLDEIIAPVDQYHWADSEYLHRTASQVPEQRIARAVAGLPPGASKMSRLPLYGECLADISAFIDLVLPDPLGTMEKYWTISDCPSTNGGRYYTVNVGVLEMLRCIRAFEDRSCLNTIVWPELIDEYPNSTTLFTFEEPEGMQVFAYNITYPKATITAAEFETGSLRGLLESNPEVLADARALAIALMRTGTAGLFRRWHSKELARETLLEIWEHRQRR